MRERPSRGGSQRGTWVTAAMMIGLASFPAAASAQGASALGDPTRLPEPDVRLELLGGATAPIDLGIAARLVVLDRLILSLSVGAGVYGDVFDSLASAFALDAGALPRLSNGLFVTTAAIGVRPFDDLGLELLAGYTLMHRSARLAATDLASLGAQTASAAVDAELLMHALHVELGWTFVILEHLLVRPAIGWTQALAADVSLAPDAASTAASSTETSTALEAASETAEDALATYGMTPTVSLSIGYRF